MMIWPYISSDEKAPFIINNVKYWLTWRNDKLTFFTIELNHHFKQTTPSLPYPSLPYPHSQPHPLSRPIPSLGPPPFSAHPLSNPSTAHYPLFTHPLSPPHLSSPSTASPTDLTSRHWLYNTPTRRPQLNGPTQNIDW